ncbi:MAG: hypothetical protein HYX89_01665 [Chloroflexi bacterium]|nr:hypothetical protein [Chloroflexota bacterium]
MGTGEGRIARTDASPDQVSQTSAAVDDLDKAIHQRSRIDSGLTAQ